jgi:hypothetical protein
MGICSVLKLARRRMYRRTVIFADREVISRTVRNVKKNSGRVLFNRGEV